jgi:predicted nucleic acid-binding protein
MAQSLPIPSEVFLDTSYAIALSSSRDQFHARAIALADQLEQSETRSYESLLNHADTLRY